MTKQRRSFTPKFKREAAGLVLNQGYSHIESVRSPGLVETALPRRAKQLQEERQGVTPKNKALPPEEQKIHELEARIDRLDRESAILKRLPCPEVGQAQSYALIDQLNGRESVEVACSALDGVRYCYYAHRLRRCRVDTCRVDCTVRSISRLPRVQDRLVGEAFWACCVRMAQALAAFACFGRCARRAWPANNQARTHTSRLRLSGQISRTD